MPRFFFDFFDGAEVTPDQTGNDLPDEEVARVEATRTLSEIALQELPGDGPERSFHIAVRDDQGTMLFEVHLDFHTVDLPTDGAGKANGSGH